MVRLATVALHVHGSSNERFWIHLLRVSRTTHVARELHRHRPPRGALLLRRCSRLALLERVASVGRASGAPEVQLRLPPPACGVFAATQRRELRRCVRSASRGTTRSGHVRACGSCVHLLDGWSGTTRRRGCCNARDVTCDGKRHDDVACEASRLVVTRWRRRVSCWTCPRPRGSSRACRCCCRAASTKQFHLVTVIALVQRRLLVEDAFRQLEAIYATHASRRPCPWYLGERDNLLTRPKTRRAFSKFSSSCAAPRCAISHVQHDNKRPHLSQPIA